jgi:hypothetical protein
MVIDTKKGGKGLAEKGVINARGRNKSRKSLHAVEQNVVHEGRIGRHGVALALVSEPAFKSKHFRPEVEHHVYVAQQKLRLGTSDFPT